MRRIVTLLVVFVLSAMAMAQTSVYAGTVIPVRLKSAIDLRTAKAGQVISAAVAQDVPLENGATIRYGTPLIGEVVGRDGDKITLRLDKLNVSGQPILVTTVLRALASPFEVQFAQTRTSGEPFGSNPAWAQTLQQVGGDDVVYRQQETVNDGLNVIGKSVWAGDWGVLTPAASCGAPDHAAPPNAKPQALWVFSHEACGVYGYNAAIASRGNPDQGNIQLQSTSGDLKLYSGTAILLEVTSVGQRGRAASSGI
jgi:hypothetical protein